MAWQLLYTSAPRLLEAGRSGFGTVARHRALSPLLVAAIERASQFTRSPGAGAGHVIYCHRIIPIAGGRFHVLSAIRDAGADYTGRTNHLAHHLIAEPREIARLGEGAPSPAEVLLALPWATAWEEPPRFLEEGDEVALETLRQRPGGSAWAALTGEARHAALLTTGEAARGAWLLCPPETDLRPLYDESLRLMPDRRWQISFTTALQPSDEAGDFRWIGLEETSPLRPRAESSGRALFDLTAPATLPPVELPPTAAARPVTARAAIPVRVAVPRATEAVATPETTPRAPRKWGRVALAGAAVVLLGLGAGYPFFTAARQRREVREEIGSLLSRTDYFSAGVIEELKKAEPPGLAREIARGADRALQIAEKADFAAMRTLPEPALAERARQAGLNIPGPIKGLEQRLREIGDFQPVLSKVDERDFDQLAQRTEALTASAGATNPFAESRRVLSAQLAERRAEASRRKAPARPHRREPAERKAAAPAAPVAAVPLWFFASGSELSLPLPAPATPVKFFLKTAAGAETELSPYGPPTPGGPDTRDLGPGGLLFHRQGGQLTAGSKAPEAPWELALRAPEGPELAHVYVGPVAALAERSLTVRREGSHLRLADPLPPLPQAEAGTLLLLTPAEFDGGLARRLPLSASGEADLAGPLAELGKLIAKKRAEADALAKQAETFKAQPRSAETLQARAQDYLKAFKKESARKAFQPKAGASAEVVGDFAKALAEEWSSGDKDPTFEELRKAGSALGQAQPEQARARNKELQEVVLRLEGKYRNVDKAEGLSKLRGLGHDLALLLGDSALAEAETVRLRKAAEAAEREAKALEGLPLPAGRLPPGEYTLLARLKNGYEVKLGRFTQR